MSASGVPWCGVPTVVSEATRSASPSRASAKRASTPPMLCAMTFTLWASIARTCSTSCSARFSIAPIEATRTTWTFAPARSSLDGTPRKYSHFRLPSSTLSKPKRPCMSTTGWRGARRRTGLRRRPWRRRARHAHAAARSSSATRTTASAGRAWFNGSRRMASRSCAGKRSAPAAHQPAGDGFLPRVEVAGVVLVAAAPDGLALGRIGMDDPGHRAERDPVHDRHRELVDHVAGVLRDDGGAEDLPLLPDVDLAEALVLAVEDGAVD